MPLTLVLALAAAVALDRASPGSGRLFRVGFYLPVVTSIVAVAVVWQFLLQTDFGLINTVLGWFGIARARTGSATRTARMPALILMASWRNFGTAMIIFLAGLQAVPRSCTRRPRIDGAGAWQRFRHITLPLLRPTLLFVAVIASDRLPAVLRGAVRDDQGRPAQQHDLGVVVHVQAVRLRQLRLRRGDELHHLRGRSPW